MSRYPNPANVLYPTTLPAPFGCKLTTRNAGKLYPMHDHSAFINSEGTGNTAVDASHFHRVIGWKVIPDESDGHTHQLTRLPCGTGG